MLADRMMLSECVELVHRMMTAYSDRSADDGYIGAIASVLAEFPRVVAVKASSPVHGVPRECKQFKPTAGQVADWCEREVEFYRRMADREGAPRLPAPVMDRGPRLSIDELRARHGPNWGLKDMRTATARRPVAAPTNDELLAIYGRRQAIQQEAG